MPALNFKLRFADLVAEGVKPHSIRAWRKRPFRVDDDLSFYTAMRTTACRKLRPNSLCTAAVPVEVNARQRYVILGDGSRFYRRGRLDGHSLGVLALLDGFDGVDEMFAFFEAAHGGILCGQLVEWNPEEISRRCNMVGSAQRTTARKASGKTKQKHQAGARSESAGSGCSVSTQGEK